MRRVTAKDDLALRKTMVLECVSVCFHTFTKFSDTVLAHFHGHVGANHADIAPAFIVFILWVAVRGEKLPILLGGVGHEISGLLLVGERLEESPLEFHENDNAVLVPLDELMPRMCHRSSSERVTHVWPRMIQPCRCRLLFCEVNFVWDVFCNRRFLQIAASV